MPACAPTPSPARCGPGQLHVAIIGAGATGTELAAELHRTARAIVAYGLDRIDPERKDIHIVLIEAAERILPALPERISNATTRPANASWVWRCAFKARVSPRCGPTAWCCRTGR